MVNIPLFLNNESVYNAMKLTKEFFILEAL